jgi:O-antigen ligase
VILFYLLVAIMPLTRHSWWSDINLGGLTANKWLGLLCLGVALAHLALRPTRVRFLHTVQARLFLLFAMLSITSFLIRGMDPSGLDGSLLTSFLSFIGLFMMTLVLVDSPDRLHSVLLSLIGGLAFVSLHALREWQAAGMSLAVRPGWVAGDPNYLSLSLLLGLPLAFLLAVRPSPRWEKIFSVGCLLTMLFAFALASSRGGFIGLIGAFVMLACHSARAMRVRLLTIGGMVIVLLLALPASPLVRMIYPSASDQGSNALRSDLLVAGWNMFTQNLWLGVGVGNYRFLVGRYGAPEIELTHIAHNTYLDIAAEQGVFGLLLFLAIVYSALRSLNRTRRLTDFHSSLSFLRTAALGVQAGLLGGATAMLFLSALHLRGFWFTIFVSSCFQLVAESCARRLSRVPPPVDHRAEHAIWQAAERDR